jgi:hypothetical protein
MDRKIMGRCVDIVTIVLGLVIASAGVGVFLTRL